MQRRIIFVDTNSTLLSILMILLGLVLALWPGLVMTTAVKLLGAALLVGGGISLFSWYRGRAAGAGYLNLAEAILLIIAGIFVLSSPMLILSILPIAVGAVILVNGIINLVQVLELKRWGYANWLFSLALAVLTALSGLVILLNPFSTMEMLLTAMGIIVIYNGASNLWINYRCNRL